MSISGALNNAVSGLTLNGRLSEVVSNNLANSQTDGYGRREAVVQSGTLGGVKVASIQRMVDIGVISDRRLADADVGRQQRGASVLSRLEQTFGPVGDPNGVAGRLTALEQAFVSAGSDPSSELRLTSVLNRAQGLQQAFRSDADAIKAQREAADAAIATDVETLNSSLSQVEDLNADITRLINRGHDPSSAMDRRQQVIDKISGIVPLKQVDRGNEQVALYTLSGAALIDGKAATFEFNRATTIVPAMTMASGGLQGVSMNGVPLDVDNGYGRMKGGSLEAAFVLRDTTLVELQAGLDNMAADLISRFEGTAVDPTQAAGDVGIFTDGGAPLDPLDITGLSLRMAVNPAIDPQQGGDVTLLRDGLGAIAPGPVGNGAQIDSWLNALREPRAAVVGGALRSAAGHAADQVAMVGQARLTAEEQLSYETARQSTMKTAELAGGVDTDKELQRLLVIEQAYAANARVIQAAEVMMQRILEI